MTQLRFSIVSQDSSVSLRRDSTGADMAEQQLRMRAMQQETNAGQILKMEFPSPSMN